MYVHSMIHRTIDVPRLGKTMQAVARHMSRVLPGSALELARCPLLACASI